MEPQAVAGSARSPAGKTIKRILVGYDNPAGPARFRGWVDDIRIVAGRSRRRRSEARPTTSLTTRGTHSTGGFSRGNNFPATAVPHGFNFWTPMTDAGSTSWLYEYHRDEQRRQPADARRRSRLSHEPSPWMGDRQTFQVMPSPAAGVPERRPRRPGRCRSGTRTRSPSRTTTASRFENGHADRDRADRPRGDVPVHVHRRQRRT